MSTLICEEPFSAAVESGLLQNVCHSCFLYSRERKLRFCSRCLTVHYCSVKCQRNDWHDHSAECKCLKKYSPRIPSCFVRLLARFYWKMSAKGQAAVSFNSRRCYDLADISAESIRTATQADRLIQLVIDYTKSGNRPKVNRHSPLWHYNNRRNTHYTKLIQAEDENAFKKVCLLAYDGFRHRKTCQDLPKMSIRGKAELQSWPKPRSPWTGVHADFAGPMEGRYYLLNVDAYSKWPEIVQMPSISSTATIQAMKWIFAKFGNPETLATDKGTQSTFFCSSYTVPFVRKEVWTRHVNQLRPRIATTAANTFLDVFDVPLLDSASKNDGATLTADSFQ